MRKTFSLYNGIDEYYDIKRRLRKPLWAKVCSSSINMVLNSIGRVKLPHMQEDQAAIDMHVHTNYSYCSFNDIKYILLKASAIGLSGICIMDHHTLDGYKNALEVSKQLKDDGLIPENFIIIPAIEYSSKDGHVGGIFCDKDIRFKEYSAHDTCKMVKDMGGLSIAVHPYSDAGINNLIFETELDAVEVYSGSIIKEKDCSNNIYLTQLDMASSLAKIGASDSHYTNTLGMCFTLFPKSDLSLDGIRNNILNNNTVPMETQYYDSLVNIASKIIR